MRASVRPQENFLHPLPLYFVQSLWAGNSSSTGEARFTPSFLLEQLVGSSHRAAGHAQSLCEPTTRFLNIRGPSVAKDEEFSLKCHVLLDQWDGCKVCHLH
jgi:hypothetical protein